MTSDDGRAADAAMRGGDQHTGPSGSGSDPSQAQRLGFLAKLTPAGLLQELLATLHRDGGHYAKRHGLAKAVLDAELRHARRFNDEDIKFLAARLRRLFKHFNTSVPKLAANDDEGLLGVSGSLIGQLLLGQDLTAKQPINMLLFCPKCKHQHIDESKRCSDWSCKSGCVQPLDCSAWTNPPHRSHLCRACGCIWRPADVPTNGVARIESKGKNDNWEPK